MMAHLFSPLGTWSATDTWIVITAALAGMACALPGALLMLRRQSMMGDALSHTVLPGIALAFLVAHGLLERGWLGPEAYQAAWHGIMFLGAVVVGVATAVLTRSVERFGRVESSAALGVVFTTLFAIGLILIRAAADRVHLDPDCVLYGMIETVVLDPWGQTSIPRAAVVNGAVLAVNLGLAALFYKELKLAAFDPALATALGIPAWLLDYGSMAVTAATLVAAFESVGSILVVAMLIVPAATAYLLTNRLDALLGLALAAAAASAVLGHVLALVVPPAIFAPLGYPEVEDASTAGMMAVAAGVMFVAAWLFSPAQGLVSRAVRRAALIARIASEDLLGLLYRGEEFVPGAQASVALASQQRTLLIRFVQWRLVRRGWIEETPYGIALTPEGRRAAAELVRGHRLWEAYLSTHLGLPDRTLHASAHALEHFLDAPLREELAQQLGSPDVDPHGRVIPPEVAEGQ